ncbi:MAG TPA: molecular chaperone TorD family protein [Syntrophomonadaceae bacterium]|nr:molecular chaperone TorD family protein [Syntrophomonadaceae bacterium]
MTEVSERLNLLQARTALYSLLAKATDYPDEALFESLVRGEFTSQLRKAGSKVLRGECLDRELEAIEMSYTDKGNLLLELQKDYTRMCFASKPRLVPLFESVYKEGKLFQESTFEIAMLYDQAGLKLAQDFKLPPDHITLELEFMAYLCFQEGKAVGSCNGENEKIATYLQREVLEKHVGQFGISFAERLEKHARHPFYRSMACLLVEFLLTELSRCGTACNYS